MKIHQKHNTYTNHKTKQIKYNMKLKYKILT